MRERYRVRALGVYKSLLAAALAVANSASDESIQEVLVHFYSINISKP